MSADAIIVMVNGTRFGGWKAAEATTSIESVCGQFGVELMDKWTEESRPIEIKPGDECQVLLGDEPVITGYIDNVSPAIDADNHSVNISGRDRTCDLVDCSAMVPSFELIGLDLAAIARRICAEFDGMDVKVETDVGAPFDRFAVQPGETAFACIDRVAKSRGVLLTTDGDGRLVLSAKGVFKDTGDALIYGQNIKQITSNRDWKNRFQTYTVHGHRKWTQIEDHRGEKGYVAGQYTEIKSPGPLPEGWSTEPPPDTRTPDEIRIAEIKSWFEEIDRFVIRPMRAKLAGMATAEDEIILVELEHESKALRDELSTLANAIKK